MKKLYTLLLQEILSINSKTENSKKLKTSIFKLKNRLIPIYEIKNFTLIFSFNKFTFC